MNAMYWKEIWEWKGRLETNDLKELDGFEDAAIDPKEIADKIVLALNIKKSDNVLEVGCGAGMIAQYLDCNYTGIDYSRPLVEKHIKILNHRVLVTEADNIPFKDRYFDKAFAFSVFHYFPDKAYVARAIEEMKRVCRGWVLIGDLPVSSHRKEHLLFDKSDFKDEILDSFYKKERFNILIK